MSTVRLPRMLSETVGVDGRHLVTGTTVREALDDLFEQAPGLRNHIFDESRVIRSHVSVFVDGDQADLDTEVGPTSEVRILHAVSGG